MAVPLDAYPHFAVTHIQHPNRLYAIPLLGIFVKLLICIPQYIIFLFVGIAWLVVVFLINPFVVLFSGKYLDLAHSLTLGLLRLSAKVTLYFFGLTDKYPGFNLQVNSDFELDIPKPATPNRIFAIPLLGGFFRILILIPYYLYMGVVEYAAIFGAIGSSFVVLFSGRYPESVYELTRDYFRLYSASMVYVTGMSDSYPSFWISMTNKNIKIALLILAGLYYFFTVLGNIGASMSAVSQGVNDDATSPSSLYEEESMNQDAYYEDDAMYQYETQPSQAPTY